MPAEGIPIEFDTCDDSNGVERDVNDSLEDSNDSDGVERDVNDALVDSNVKEALVHPM